MPENAIYVGRPTKWGNAFIIGHIIEFGEGKDVVTLNTREEVIKFYEYWLFNTVEGKRLRSDIGELRGHDLACFCKEGEPCHADILLKIANE